ncbi:MAG: response regulator [Deltaproteobacteria bacterium]|nr:response regulator [Deltaproteobacteria bacterium]MBN2671100.1 response regulator [Deltaproteobacteria bacterium]
MSGLVLVVDDSVVLRSSVKFTLEEAGYEVAEADNGKTGLDKVKELMLAGKRPGMIISDVNMPVMDGITFIKELKQGAGKFIPVLVLTTESQPAMKQAGKEAGAAGWLVKPFKNDQLIQVVRKFVR